MGYVLVADDDHGCRTLLSMEIRQLGHEVALAEDGQQAVELAADRTPDLIILDVMMPRLDGFSACRQIRSLAGCEAVPVLALTSLDDSFGVQEAQAAGFDALMFKPWKVQVLQAKVQALLSGGG